MPFPLPLNSASIHTGKCIYCSRQVNKKKLIYPDSHVHSTWKHSGGLLDRVIPCNKKGTGITYHRALRALNEMVFGKLTGKEQTAIWMYFGRIR